MFAKYAKKKYAKDGKTYFQSLGIGLLSCQTFTDCDYSVVIMAMCQHFGHLLSSSENLNIKMYTSHSNIIYSGFFSISIVNKHKDFQN